MIQHCYPRRSYSVLHQLLSSVLEGYNSADDHTVNFQDTAAGFCMAKMRPKPLESLIEMNGIQPKH